MKLKSPVAALYATILVTVSDRMFAEIIDYKDIWSRGINALHENQNVFKLLCNGINFHFLSSFPLAIVSFKIGCHFDRNEVKGKISPDRWSLEFQTFRGVEISPVGRNDVLDFVHLTNLQIACATLVHSQSDCKFFLGIFHTFCVF